VLPDEVREVELDTYILDHSPVYFWRVKVNNSFEPRQKTAVVGRFLYNIIRACIYYYSRLGTAMAQHGIRAELNIMMRRNPYFFVALFGDSTSPGLILKTMSSWRHVLRSWY